MDCPINHLPDMPIAISSHYNNSKNNSTTGSLEGAKIVNQTCLLGAPPIGREVLRNETTTGNGTTGTPGGTGVVTGEAMECVLNKDDIERFFGY